jgi:hypothetical protein
MIALSFTVYLLVETASDRCFSTISSYEGKHNETYTGKSCQYWNETSPHNHDKFSDSQFPDRNVEEAQNFCRDPYSEGYLWCFTTDPGTRLEPCLFDCEYLQYSPLLFCAHLQSEKPKVIFISYYQSYF